MVGWWVIPVCLFVGVFIGIMSIALVSANRED